MNRKYFWHFKLTFSLFHLSTLQKSIKFRETLKYYLGSTDKQFLAKFNIFMTFLIIKRINIFKNMQIYTITIWVLYSLKTKFDDEDNILPQIWINSFIFVFLEFIRLRLAAHGNGLYSTLPLISYHMWANPKQTFLGSTVSCGSKNTVECGGIIL